MFRTLRSRLLLSYGAVITIILIIIAVFLFLLVVATQRSRIIEPELQRLTTMSRVTIRALNRWQENGGGPENLRRELNNIADDLGTRILIVDSNDTIAFDSGGNWENRPFQLEDLPPRLREGLVLEEGRSIGRIVTPGRTWLGFKQDVNYRNRTFSVVYTVPEPSAFASFRNSFLIPLLQAGGAALLVAVLLAFWISRSVARPLQNMAVAAQAIAEGDYNQKLDIVGPSEVRQVASNFNNMAEQVKLSQQAQRDFVANVSHDLKTPLTSIQGWSQAFLDGAVQTAEQQGRAAGIIHSEAERMNRMVNQLLDLAKLESGQLPLVRERLSVAQLIKDTQRNLSLTAETKGVSLSAEIEASNALTTVGDPDRLSQVMTNLVDNALEHTPNGGAVMINAKRANGHIQVDVADTGKGIPQEELARIFERFYQVDKARTGHNRGTGLGLSIVKQVVEAHGGLVKAQSEIGRGSTFTLLLPAS